MRWEEAAEAEGHTRLLRCTAQKVAAKLRAAAEATARGRARLTGGAGGVEPEFRGAARGCGPQKQEEGGESGGAPRSGPPSSCGSAPAAAAAAEEAIEKMPALRPARLWVLLALWLCRAAPARGEYPAGGAAPHAAVRAPTGHLGGPSRPPLCEKGRAPVVRSERGHLVP